MHYAAKSTGLVETGRQLASLQHQLQVAKDRSDPLRIKFVKQTVEKARESCAKEQEGALRIIEHCTIENRNRGDGMVSVLFVPKEQPIAVQEVAKIDASIDRVINVASAVFLTPFFAIVGYITGLMLESSVKALQLAILFQLTVMTSGYLIFSKRDTYYEPADLEKRITRANKLIIRNLEEIEKEIDAEGVI